MRSAPARRHNGVLVAALSAVCAILVAACTGGGSTSASATTNPHRTADLTPSADDWPTFGHDTLRTATVHGGAITPTFSAGSTKSVRLDGAVYGQPLVVGNTVFAATENDSVYAVSALDGSVLWRSHLAEPFHPTKCGNIRPLGITGTPLYDGGRLYVVAEDAAAHHILAILDAATGAVRQRVTMDPPTGNREDTQQRPALAVMYGRVYAAFGGLFGDCGTYTGAVGAVRVGQDGAPEAGVGTPRPAADPDVDWYQASTSGRGGIWAPGGAPLVGGALFYSVGNGNAGPGDPWDDTDSVVALAPELEAAGLARSDFFAPAQWAADNAADADLGSMNPAYVAGHFVIAGKSGLGYVLPAKMLGDPADQTPAFDHCAGFGAAAVDGDIAFLPCATGVAAVQVRADRTASVLWRAAVPANGSPSVGGGYVWSTDYSSGVLYALDPATGKVAGQTKTEELPHFAAPSVSGKRLFLATMTGLQIFSG